jgi:hypothetical protein
MRNLLQSRENAEFSGAELALERVEGRGRKPAWMLIVRIQDRSGGAATVVKNMLLSMNFEEESMSRTCSVGWIDIRYLWKPKDLPDHWWQSEFGLPVISILETGIQNWTMKQKVP